MIPHFPDYGPLIQLFWTVIGAFAVVILGLIYTITHDDRK